MARGWARRRREHPRTLLLHAGHGQRRSRRLLSLARVQLLQLWLLRLLWLVLLLFLGVLVRLSDGLLRCLALLRVQLRPPLRMLLLQV